MRTSWRYLLIGVWALLVMAPVSYFAISHYIVAPPPAAAATAILQETARKLQRARGRAGQWLAVHVVAEGCGCSAQVLDHLFARARLGFPEHVVYIGEGHEMDERLDALGFSHENLSATDLERRFGLVSAPYLIVIGEGGELLYVGGYTKRSRSPVQDLQIVDTLVAGGKVEPLPVFGCVISRHLQDKVDPLRLKYKPSDGAH